MEIAACGVCRSDLHVVDGELPDPMLPLVPGHEILGRVAATGDGVGGFARLERVGVPCLGQACRAPPCCCGRIFARHTSAPWRRSMSWTSRAGTSRGARPEAQAKAAQTPAAWPVAIAVGVTR
jgi:Zn-dependent alcohol dehydrogenase